ncbi:MAG: polyprenyl synthetase family protein [Tannerella sp.]|jgi:geranylgeranyl pyrophosphate synthase|nr:polyprenyl synthetase family protein [Tannerella sp.]
MENTKTDILNELFASDYRKQVDAELKRLVNEYVSNSGLKSNILYHLCLDEDVKPTLEHSKRLRAYLCLIMAEENGFKVQDIVPLSVVLELIHNASLIIDDIQDDGIMRCGRLALWKKIGIPLAINAAYFMSHISLAYYNWQCQIHNYYNYSKIILQSIADFGNGQQLDLESNKEMSFDIYEKISEGKTGTLLKLSLLFGLMPYNYCESIYKQISEFAALFAYAYQIGDDICDLKQYQKQNTKNIDTSNIYFCFEKKLDTNLIEKTIFEIEKYQRKKQANVYEMLNSITNAKNIKINKITNLINALWKKNWMKSTL